MSRNTSAIYAPHYEVFLVTLTVFTLLDVLLTVVGLSVGCRELNPVVTQWGLPSWILFRILLLGCLISIFITGYYLCRQYTSKGLQILKIIHGIGCSLY